MLNVALTTLQHINFDIVDIETDDLEFLLGKP